MTQNTSITSILLAAGISSRMGSVKALLPWENKTLIEWQIEKIQESGIEEIIVVLGSNAEEIQNRIKNLEISIVLNPDYEKGKTTTIKKGLAGVKNPESDIMLLAVDQPRHGWILKKVIDNHIRNKSLISCPIYKGSKGHPIIFQNKLRKELFEIEEKFQGIRKITTKYTDSVNTIEVESGTVNIDINTPEEYQEAIKIFSRENKFE